MQIVAENSKTDSKPGNALRWLGAINLLYSFAGILYGIVALGRVSGKCHAFLSDAAPRPCPAYDEIHTELFLVQLSVGLLFLLGYSLGNALFSAAAILDCLSDKRPAVRIPAALLGFVLGGAAALAWALLLGPMFLALLLSIFSG